MRTFYNGVIILSIMAVCLPSQGQIEKEEIIHYTPAPKYTPFFIPTLTHVYFTTATESNTSEKPTPTPTQNIPVVTPLPSKTPFIYPSNKVNLPVVTPIPQAATVATPIAVATVSPTATPSPIATPSLVDILAIPVRKETTRTVEEVPVPVTPTPKVPNKEKGTFKELWKTDYIKAYKDAQKSKRPILVFIGFGTCYQCKELEKDIQSLFTGHYERVYIDREKNVQYKKYFATYKLAPTLLMIDSANSKITKKIIGYEHSDFQKLASFINR